MAWGLPGVLLSPRESREVCVFGPDDGNSLAKGAQAEKPKVATGVGVGGASTHALDSNCNVSFRSGRRNDNKSQGACGIVTIRARQAAVDVGATAKMSGKPG